MWTGWAGQNMHHAAFPAMPALEVRYKSGTRTHTLHSPALPKLPRLKLPRPRQKAARQYVSTPHLPLYSHLSSPCCAPSGSCQ